MTTTQCTCTGCAVQQGTHQPAEAVHQIDEPQAEALLELAAYRFTVENREARIAELESQLEAIGAGGVEPLRKPAAAQQAVQVIKANCYSDDNGDYWRDCPDDCDFVDGLKVGDTYELQASIRAWSETFRVTKAPDETSDDYEVELVSTDAPLAATQPAAQGMESSKLTDKLTAALIAMRDIGALEDGLLGDDPQVVKAQKASRKALDAALAAQAKQGGA